MESCAEWGWPDTLGTIQGVPVWLGGDKKDAEEEDQWPNQLITAVYVKKPLAKPVGLLESVDTR